VTGNNLILHEALEYCINSKAKTLFLLYAITTKVQTGLSELASSNWTCLHIKLYAYMNILWTLYNCYYFSHVCWTFLRNEWG